MRTPFLRKSSHTQTKLSHFTLNWVGVVIMLLSCSFFTSCSTPPQKDIKKEKLSLGISKSFLSIPIYIAAKKGFFKEEGLEVNIHEYPSGKLATEAMLSGDMDISTVADMPIVFNAFKQKDFCVLTTFTSSYYFTKIFARQDQGIQSSADLKGKKVGANKGTSSHFYLGTFLTDNKLSMSDVEMVQYKTVDLSDALINKDVDAISVWQPHELKAKAILGEKLIELPGGEIYRTTFSLAVNENFIEVHQSALQKLIQALNKAAGFCNTNKMEAIDIIAEVFAIDRKVISSSWDNYKFGTFLDQALLIGLDDVARWAIENKFVAQQTIPNFYNYMCPEILEAVFPEQVSIIR